MSDLDLGENPALPPHTPKGLLVVEALTFTLVGAGLILASCLGWTSSSPTEIFGFLSGGLCVWLGVRQSIWTWPLGLANYCAFFVLFARTRLFADATLQIIYFALGIYGWRNWSKGESSEKRPAVTKACEGEWLFLVVASPFSLWGMYQWLIFAKGASPFWDSLTTVLSLAAQFLMCRKKLENWLIWIVADLIYVPLYVHRGLPLTAVLYLVFLAMCVAGWFQWKTSLVHERVEENHGRPVRK